MERDDISGQESAYRQNQHDAMRSTESRRPTRLQSEREQN